MFWIGVTALASAVPIEMPRGSIVNTSIAPLVVVLSLGGPTAAGWVALVGTVDARELRREVPWYGTLANHAGLALPAILGGVAASLFSALGTSPIASLVATAGGALAFFVSNLAITAIILGLRHGQSPLYLIRLSLDRYIEMREMFTQTVSSLAGAVDARDKYTAGHSRRVQQISVDIGRVLRLSAGELEALEWGGLLHDIGKIGVPDDVLLKPDRLTKEERAMMNAHPVIGANIIAPVTKLAPELPIIRHHHEWYNGSGYPDRLIGDEIPKLARVLHVADAFEAMTAARPYRMKPLTSEQAIAELRKFAGVQFDPVMVDAFAKTHWAAGVADPGRNPEPRPPVPLLAQVANRASEGPSEAPSDAAPPTGPARDAAVASAPAPAP